VYYALVVGQELQAFADEEAGEAITNGEGSGTGSIPTHPSHRTAHACFHLIMFLVFASTFIHGLLGPLSARLLRRCQTPVYCAEELEEEKKKQEEQMQKKEKGEDAQRAEEIAAEQLDKSPRPITQPEVPWRSEIELEPWQAGAGQQAAQAESGIMQGSTRRASISEMVDADDPAEVELHEGGKVSGEPVQEFMERV
jgi:hypothetical protein